MADTKKTVAEDHDGKIMTERSQVIPEIDAVVAGRNDVRQNDICERSSEIHVKEQELPEPIRHRGESKGMMPCLPSINLSELATILRDPNMPSQKILKEVADKIMLKSEESESDDGSVSSSGGGVVGMKGLLDCIFEVSYMHEDSASSEDDDSFERFSREIPCNFCSKIFGSTMTWNTHVLVAHPQLDSSVLNIRRMSANEGERKEKSHPSRKHSRGLSKSDYDKDTKVHQTSTVDRKQAAELTHSENTPVRKRRSSFSRYQQKEPSATCKSDHKGHSVKKESQPKEKEITCRVPCDLIKETEEVFTAVSLNESVGSVDHVDSTGQQLQTDHFESCSTENKIRESLTTDGGTDPQVDMFKHLAKSSSKGKKHRIASIDYPTQASTIDSKLGEHTQSKRKRRAAATLPESTLHMPSSSNSKHSVKKNIAKDSVSSPQHKQSDISASKVTPKDIEPESKRSSKVDTVQSSKGL